ncbi:ABC transporter permease subunit [Hamadaea tsunoensis]|uniref:ABC transporter permease subunit n=1 Tax=Hamadaea tsunoensis TaxID=53368 RepID=UPI0003F9D22F|nr:ABC transporter permease subunit [Hamadaea tsunoensis]
MRTLRAEWTKLRTVRGWVVALLAAAAAIIGLGVLPGMQGTCDATCRLPVGPDGTEVTDVLYFVHKPLTGDGSLTVRLDALTGILPSAPDQQPDPTGGGPQHADGDGGRPGLVPWAKTGILIKDGTRSGSSYAALMLTGTHGVRMQYDFTNDIAGPAGGGPRWLRLTRAGGTVTGEVSADGTTWTKVAGVTPSNLPATAEIGVFATSPQYTEAVAGALGLHGASGGPTSATGAYEQVTLTGTSASGWRGDQIGGGGDRAGTSTQDGDRITVTGSGDIAPAVAGPAGLGVTITQTLAGTFAGLILVVVVATMFVTAEYRRGIMRTTMSAQPRRGRILAAKAVVIGGVVFAVGLVAAATVVTLGQRMLESSGVYVHSASLAVRLQVIVGTAAVLAVAAVLALGLGAVIRRSAAAVTTAIVAIVLPYLLAMTVLPDTAAQWMLRITPAAALAVQQSTPEYAQVSNLYTPVGGYFPLSPLGGFLVLCGWTALVLAIAGVLLRRRDA